MLINSSSQFYLEERREGISEEKGSLTVKDTPIRSIMVKVPIRMFIGK